MHIEGGGCMEAKPRSPDEIKAARKEYYAKWRKEHPEQVRNAQMRFWTRQAERMKDPPGDESTEQDEP